MTIDDEDTRDGFGLKLMFSVVTTGGDLKVAPPVTGVDTGDGDVFDGDGASDCCKNIEGTVTFLSGVGGDASEGGSDE